MNPTSLIFFTFVAITLIVYYIVPKKGQWIVLLSASLFFFGYASKWLILYLLLTTALIYAGGVFVEKLNQEFQIKKAELGKTERKTLKSQIKQRQNRIVSAVVMISVGILVVLKYGNFLGSIVNDVSKLFGNGSVVPAIKIAVPLGISYYTLMAISYIVDVNRGVVAAEENPLRLLLFVCYFPHITEGPFDTYGKLAPQLKEHHSFDYDKFMNAGSLFLLGLVKKMVLADRLAYIANEIFDHFENYSGLTIMIGMLAFTVQIYFDFSGCIDIVRGISKMFGVEMEENFKRPFFSKSIQEFWRRWHISLGTWLKNYVFYPVSLSKLSKRLNNGINTSSYISITLPTLLPLFCVWMTMGIWHGASWKYVIYGLYYFIIIALGLLLEPLFKKLFDLTKIKRDGKIWGVFQMLRTNILVLIGLTMFRANTLTHFASMVKASFDIHLQHNFVFIGSIPDIQELDCLLAVTLIIAFMVVEILEEKNNSISMIIEKRRSLRWLWITAAILLVVIFGIYGTGYTQQVSVYAEF